MRAATEHLLSTVGQGLGADREETESPPSAALVPVGLPGRSTRKARRYETQILELRRQGYTLDSIRQSLALAGIHVSISTVQREAARRPARTKPAPASMPRASAAPAARPPPSAPPAPSAPPPAFTPAPAAIAGSPSMPVEDLTGPTPKDLAEAYVKGKSANPLARAKERS